MAKILLYTILLILGIALSTFVDLSPLRPLMNFVSMVFLAYIVIEVGLEFDLDKKRLGCYGKDYLVAFTAAFFPWILCSAYFFWMFGLAYEEALLIGRFAAPTSAGVLFAMLEAAGLATTWLFKKARVLAIFDDLDTILLMIPLQILVVGFRWSFLVVVPVLIILLWIAYRFLHRLRWPTNTLMMVFYSVVLVIIVELIERSTHVQVEILLPAFVLGCVLYEPKDHAPEELEHTHIEPLKPIEHHIDAFIKAAFMFLAGAALPPLKVDGHMGMIILNVIVITLLSNIGKAFPSLCYRKEASLKERIALSFAMFPRGEVGAGVLLVALSYGLSGAAVGVASLSLDLNLLLTGLFIWIVVKLTQKTTPPASKLVD